MKALLLHRDRDFDAEQALPAHEASLTQDLELPTLLGAMARDDAFVLDVARKVLLAGAGDVETIAYRQEIVNDSVANAAVVRSLYALAVEAIEGKRKHYFGIFTSSPTLVLHGAVDLMQMFAGMLARLRTIAEDNAGRFESDGFTALFAMLREELDDAYFARIDAHLKELKFRHGVLMSVDLGRGGESTNFVLRRPQGKPPNWFQRLLGDVPPHYTFRLHERDEAGGRILTELQSRAVNGVANALAQSADHVQSFFEMLRTELAFYVGCINLHETLTAHGVHVCFPEPLPLGARVHRYAGLVDVCLALGIRGAPVGNSHDAADKGIVVVTGANQGGKSSFLRAVGVAQLMMQCGLFVGAASFSAGLAAGVYTHYKREEDATMEGGKLDEELERMSRIADALTPHALVLFNESFASTNEREGSEIARQVVDALRERHIKVFYVTHLVEFARGLYERRLPDALFLRAERRADGTRTFRLLEGEPLQTSYGADVYREVFGDEAEEAEPQRTARAA